MSGGGPLPEVTPLNASYFEGTATGELRMRRCDRRGTLFRFVSDGCPTCWSTDLSTATMSGTGTVRAFTVVHVAPYQAMAARVPYALALVELSEGPVMMSNIVDCPSEHVRVGMSVEVVFEARGDVTVPQFRPIGTA